MGTDIKGAIGAAVASGAMGSDLRRAKTRRGCKYEIPSYCGEFAMNSVGNTLRTERLRLGLKLEELAAETKVAQHFLDAMENDQFDRLPGRFFAVSFLRQYAHALGLEEDELIVSFQQGLAAVPEPLPALPPRRPWFRLPEVLTPLWLAAGMLGVVGLYSWWHTGQWTASGAVEVMSSKGSADRVASEPAVVARSAERAPLPAAAGVPADVPGRPGVMRVAFGATEPVWMSVSSDGVQTYSGTLQGQQSKEFSASRVIRALVGNVGAVAIFLNGKPIPLNGKHGEVQMLELTAAGARVVTRTPAPQPTPEDRL
jgi:cytoskeleton protein RodZ